MVAGSLQASIIQTSTGYTYVGGYSQTFTNPSTNPGFQGSLGNTGTGNTTVTFSGITLSSSTGTGLFYDPNGNPASSVTAGGSNISPVTLCSQGNMPVGGTGLVPITGGCIGTYVTDAVNTNREGAPYSPLSGQTPNITIGFTSQMYAANFVFGIPGAGTSPVFKVTVKNGSTVIDTFTTGMGNLSNQALDWLSITENQTFNTVSYTHLTLPTNREV